MNTKTTTLAIALIALVPLVAAQGGGTVENVLPTIESGLTGNQNVVSNVQANSESFTFTARDGNTESDLVSVRIVSDAGWTAELTDLTVGTRATVEGTWTVADATANDGTLEFTFVYEWPQGTASGVYSQTAEVRDSGVYQVGGTTDQTQFTSDAQVTLTTGVCDAAGTCAAGNWGGWTATPGTTNVDTVNFLRAQNDGTASGQVAVSWSGVEFLGPSTETIAIDSNLAFGSNTGSLPAPVYGTVDVDGTETYTIAPGEVLWIGHRIAALPDPLTAGQYTASFTFTDIS